MGNVKMYSRNEIIRLVTPLVCDVDGQAAVESLRVEVSSLFW